MPDEGAVIVGQLTAFACGDDAALAEALTDIGREALQEALERERTRMEQQQPPGITPITPNMQPGGTVPGTTQDAAPLVMPKRIVKINLPDFYEGFWVKAWVNVDPRLRVRAAAMVTGLPDPDDAGIDAEEKARRTATIEDRKTQATHLLSQLIVDHNLVDFEGAPLPSTTDIDFWEFVQGEIGEVIFAAISAQRGRLDPTKPGR